MIGRSHICYPRQPLKLGAKALTHQFRWSCGFQRKAGTVGATACGCSRSGCGWPCESRRWSMRKKMLDLVALALVAVCFVFAVVYARFCDGLLARATAEDGAL